MNTKFITLPADCRLPADAAREAGIRRQAVDLKMKKGQLTVWYLGPHRFISVSELKAKISLSHQKAAKKAKKASSE